MSEILVNTIKKADGTGSITVPADSGTLLTSASDIVANSVLGTTTNDNATTGYVGEFVDSYVFQSVSTSAMNLTSISLTAGDWDVSGVLQYYGNTGSTNLILAVSLTSGTVPEPKGLDAVIGYANSGSGVGCVTIPNYRYSLSATTTIYLNGRLDSSANNCGCYITARRVR
jgi:hypothetical protein